MKHWAAILTCLLMNGAALSPAAAQQSAPRARAVVARGAGGYLGIGVAEIDDERAKAMKLKEDYGVIVMNVGEDTPAAKAGLKPSDVILEFNQQRVEGVEQFMRLVRETPPHRKVTLQILRNGATLRLDATLAARAARPGNFEFQLPEMPDMPIGEMAMPPMPPMPPRVFAPEAPAFPSFGQRSRIGIEAEPVNGQLADYFGVKDGVLVRSVNKGSPAERAGLKAGDVVVKVGSAGVRTPQDLAREFRSGGRNGNAPLTVSVVRNHREFTLSLSPEDGESRN